MLEPDICFDQEMLSKCLKVNFPFIKNSSFLGTFEMGWLLRLSQFIVKKTINSRKMLFWQTKFPTQGFTMTPKRKM